MALRFSQIDNFTDMERLYGPVFVFQYKLFTTTYLSYTVRLLHAIYVYTFSDPDGSGGIIMPNREVDSFVGRIFNNLTIRDIRIVRSWYRIHDDLKNNTVVEVKQSYLTLLGRVFEQEFVTVCISILIVFVIIVYLVGYKYRFV